jgi:hypothetical protein
MAVKRIRRGGANAAIEPPISAGIQEFLVHERRQKHYRCNDGPINLKPIAVFTGVAIMNINLGNLLENVQRTLELTYAPA